MGHWARTLCFGFVMTLLAGGALAQAPGIRASLTYNTPNGQLVLDFDCEGQSPCVGRYLLTLNSPASCGYQADAITITGLSLAASGAISGTALLKNVFSSGTTCQNRTFTDGTAVVTGTWNGSAGTLSLDFNGARFDGTFTGQSAQAPQAQNLRGRLAYDTPAAQHFTLDFDCEGRDPCVGRYLLALSGPVTCGYQTDTISITGLSLGAPGPISGTALLKNVFRTGTNCADRVFSDGTAAVSGTWNGSFGTLSLEFNDARFNGRFTGQSVQTRVAASIASTSTVHADILFRPQDIGTAGSVYVLAVAPVTVVGAALKDSGEALPPLGYAKTKEGKDTSVACVLAQINQAGQLQAVSASSLRAYVSGVLGAQGQAIQIVNNVATVQIGGATFYVGYGASGQSMLTSGTNRGVVTIPGSLECRPQPPQAGWWYNPSEGGRGFSIEAKGNRLFMAAFHYEPDGRATWNFAGGATSLDGSLFASDFLGASGGQSLTGPYRLPALSGAGDVTLAFTDATRGTMVWPGGSTAIERQPFVPGGLTAAPQPGLPESGWWWNPAESGRGFFIEWQGGFVDVAGYMYDAEGRPTWYIAALATPDPMRITGQWWTFANGQAMGQPYRPATRTSDNAGALDIRFTSATAATMTLPDGRQIPLVRQAF